MDASQTRLIRFPVCDMLMSVISIPYEVVAGEHRTDMQEVRADVVDADSAHRFAAEWDAGEMGCGEVLIQLRLRFRPLQTGDVFRLITRDIAAPLEIPAWCRVTKRQLLHAEHPEYWIEQK